MEPDVEVLKSEMKNLIDDIREVRTDIKDLHQKIEMCRSTSIILYVSKEQFAPIKNIVYGMVAIILTSVIGAILTLVLRK